MCARRLLRRGSGSVRARHAVQAGAPLRAERVDSRRRRRRGWQLVRLERVRRADILEEQLIAPRRAHQSAREAQAQAPEWSARGTRQTRSGAPAAERSHY